MNKELMLFLALVLTGIFILSKLFALIGGWSTLAKLYPGSGKVSGDSFIFCTVICRRSTFFPMNYGGPFVVVSISNQGISLRKVIPLFYPDIEIPWKSISNVSLRDSILQKKAVLTIIGFEGNVLINNLLLTDGPAKPVYEKWLHNRKSI